MIYQLSCLICSMLYDRSEKSLFTSLLQEKIIQLNCLAFTTLNFLVFSELKESHHFKILFTKHEKEVGDFFLPRVEILLCV